MATLVLTVAGGLIGGPIGAAIGGSIGSVVDREVLFKPKGREGPRLSELKLQTSSYGTQIPKLFGTMRVAGSVIWATDLVEHRSRSGGGKGRPSTTNFSYTASFAVALSARPILGIGRIWADGKLLRGAAGDWKTRTGFRLHHGSETQDPDPLIAAAEGAGQAPAHRGIAYVVFEDLELAEFGNRLPSLTFEVTADAGPMETGAILRELSGGDVVPESTTREVLGFSAHGASVRTVGEALAGAAAAWFRTDDSGLTLLSGEGAVIVLQDAGARTKRKAQDAGRNSRTISAVDMTPVALTLTHYDPARDYQSGMQRARRPGAGMREARLELPAAVEAGVAKTIAEAALTRLDSERERRSLSLGWRELAVRPGERVTIAGETGSWRVERWSLEAMVLTLDCVRIGWGAPETEASGGRVLAAPDSVLGQTIVHAFELPALDEASASAPRLAIAAAGTGLGWRSAALLTSLDGGIRWTPEGVSAPAAVLGHVVVPPAPGATAIEDRVNFLEVELAHEAMVLADADAAGLGAGANLAMAGEELLQFGSAEPLGGQRWRLGRLWRGRRGTETGVNSHAVGERFVLLDADALTIRNMPLAAVGSIARVLAQGAGDGSEAAEAQAALVGRGIVPPAPVHLRYVEAADGSTLLRWIRRSRIGWHWVDGLETPLGEEGELYHLTVSGEGGPTRTLEVTIPEAVLASEERAGPVIVAVRQVGTHGLSSPATRILPALGED